MCGRHEARSWCRAAGRLAVEGLTGFIDNMVQREHRAGRQEVHALHLLAVHLHPGRRICSGLLPLGIVPGWQPFTPTSHFSITGVLAVMSFSIVLIVGFWRHGLHFFSLFVPHGTPGSCMIPLIADRVHVLHGAPVQPRSSTVRGDDRRPHPDGSVRQLHRAAVSTRGEWRWRPGRQSCSFLLHRLGVAALELLVCAIQAYVFALLTTLYLNDAINLH